MTDAVELVLETETRELLSRQDHLSPEQAEWLHDISESAARRLYSAGAAQRTPTRLISGDQAGRAAACSVDVF
jgi:hypothetical protein